MAYGDGYRELPYNWSIEFVLMEMVIASPMLDMLDSNKISPKIIMAVLVVIYAIPEGRFIGLGVLQKFLAFGPEYRNYLHIFLWILTLAWFWLGWSKRPSPMWTVFVMMTLYGFAGYMAPFNHQSPVLAVPDVLSRDECAGIIRIAENFGQTHGWTTARHGNLSTEDIPVPDLPLLNTTLQEVLVNRLAPVTKRFFGGVLMPVDAFVVRYDWQRQTRLREHTDAGHATYSIVLSDLSDYGGGGVRFPLMPQEDSGFLMAGVVEEDERPMGRIIRAPQGQAVLHGSKVKHEGMEVVSGTRYLLISFNKIRYDTWWQWLLYFHGSVAKENVLAEDESLVAAEVPWPELAGNSE